MLKKGLSIFLATTLMILCFFSVPAFAAEPAFDISDYTFEDLESMTTAEKKELMEKFIETYNPYGLRDLMEQEDSASYGFGVQPLWKSGGDDSMATHELITLEALSEFIKDYGFYDTDGTTMFGIALYLMAASALPDREEIGVAFAGHFHDPDTDLNFLGQAWPTAATRASTHYHIAYTHLKKNVNMDITSDEFMNILERLGKCLHYVQDACEPHHASNAIAGPGSSHSDFEAYVETNIDACLQDISVPTEFYVHNRPISVFAITDDAAKQAKPLFEAVANKKDQSQWSTVGKTCIRNSVQYSASVIYKLFYECNAPFI